MCKIKHKKLDELADVVEKILDFNNQNHKGRGLKILTPDQMLSRLPTFLIQVKVENNLEKLKDEMEKLLYSFYLSKKNDKTI